MCFSLNDFKFGIVFIKHVPTFEKYFKIKFYLFHLNEVWEKKKQINIFIIKQIYKHVMYHYNIMQESIGISSKVMPKCIKFEL